MKKHVTKILWLITAVMFLTVPVAYAAEVVLYSSNPSELQDMIRVDFEKETGIKVSAVKMGTGSAMKRIQAEKDNPLCDVFWSGDVAVLDGAKDYFMSYKSAEAAVLPASYVEKDYRWTSSNAHVMIIMYNKSLVSESEKPQAWKDIFAPQWKGKVVMANPAKSGSAYAQTYGLYKLYGWEGLNKLIANAKILDSSSLIYKGVAAGEYPVGITMEYAAYRYIAGGSKDVGIIYPSDGAFVAPEGAAIIKNCPHPEEAKKFFDYLISKSTEEKIFANFYRRPARPDTAEFPGLPKISDITVMKDFDPIEANAIKKDLLTKWKEIILSK